jgi:hypothetical protein
MTGVKRGQVNDILHFLKEILVETFYMIVANLEQMNQTKAWENMKEKGILGMRNFTIRKIMAFFDRSDEVTRLFILTY